MQHCVVAKPNVRPQVRERWFYFQTRSVLLNHTLVPHIHKPQDMCAQVICSAHRHHSVPRWSVQAFLRLLGRQGIEAVESSSLLLGASELGNPCQCWVGLFVPFRSGQCDFSSLSCSTCVNHQDLCTAFCLLIWVSWLLLCPLSSHHHL